MVVHLSRLETVVYYIYAIIVKVKVDLVRHVTCTNRDTPWIGEEEWRGG